MVFGRRFRRRGGLPRKAATVMALGAAFVLTACSGGEASEGGADAGQATPSEQTAPVVAAVAVDDALAAQVPEAVRSAGVITVGSPMKAAPSNFYAEDGTTPAGYEVDLARAIGKKLDLEVRHEAMPFDSLINGLATGRIDMVMAAMNDTPQRQESIDFVDYLTSGIVMTVQKGNPEGITKPEDLCGKAVTVGLGTSQETYANELSAQCVAAGKPPVEIAVDKEHSQRINSLRTGRSDALIMDLGGGTYVAKTAGDGEYFEVVDYPLIDGAPYGIGFNKDDTQLRDAVQQALQSLMDDGTYTAILQAWGVERGAIDQAVVNGAA
jgi:polar amino acid transport system substrate-binding protein